ncbi:hypothetical protein ACFYXH_22750 [Streptomyces sp. NPDC002730]|uniref:hypothetical protein n=1 Tax=Streptomyces sp. NPDC002730 TaxID=3364662 RepID=UPI0036C311C3
MSDQTQEHQAVIDRAIEHLTTADPAIVALQITQALLPDYEQDPVALADTLRDDSQATPDRANAAWKLARCLLAAGIPEPKALETGPYEVSWKEGSQDIAQCLFWAAEAGRPLDVTLADGRVVRMLPASNVDRLRPLHQTGRRALAPLPHLRTSRTAARPGSVSSLHSQAAASRAPRR